MSSDWTTMTLGDCAHFFSGGTPRKSNESYWGGNIPWFSAKDLKSFYLNDSEDHVTEEGARNGSRTMPPGTILLLVRGMTLHNEVPIGVLTKEATFNQDIKALRAEPRVKQSFLAYWLVAQKPQLLQMVHAAGHGTGVLATDRLRAMHLELPPLDEQEAIANVFDQIEEKIKQNQRTSEALQRLARATFKAWFVDFEPVRAKADGAKCFPGMLPEAFAALPTTFTPTPTGPIPEGWAVSSLPSLMTFLNGLALQKFPPKGTPEDLPVIKIAELRKGSTDGADKASHDVPEQYVVRDGDLLFSWSGTLECEFWFGGAGALNQHLFRVTSDRLPLWLCHRWIHYHLSDFRIIASSKATTMGHIKREHLTAAQAVVPPDPQLQALSEAINSCHELVTALAIQSRKLAEVRDYLLPRLLSGQVRVLQDDPTP